LTIPMKIENQRTDIERGKSRPPRFRRRRLLTTMGGFSPLALQYQLCACMVCRVGPSLVPLLTNHPRMETRADRLAPGPKECGVVRHPVLPSDGSRGPWGQVRKFQIGLSF
jgi:hypothetical protein